MRSSFDGVHHVDDFDMDRASDEEIRRFAGTRGWMIVTKDSDYLQLLTAHGAPPKIILLLVDNQPNSVIETTLIAYRETIHAFRSSELGCLQIRFHVRP